MSSFDRREQDFKWWSEFSEKDMKVLPKWSDRDEDLDAVGDDEWIPVKWELCGTCDGRGKHVNPSIDSNGLSREDFDEDPGFREDYFSGVYDVVCAECNGRTTALVVDDEKATKAQKDSIDEFFADQRESRAIYRMETGGW